MSGVDDLVTALAPRPAQQTSMAATVASVVSSAAGTVVTVTGIATDPTVWVTCQWLDPFTAAIVAQGAGLVGQRVLVHLVAGQPVIAGLIAATAG